MQAIAYLHTDGTPRLSWAAPKQRLVLDENGEPATDADGNPTGETETWYNYQSIIDSLPAGTSYEMIEQDQAEAWWQAHRPASETIADYEQRVQDHLDTFAQSHGYDNMNSLCSYATSSNAQWAKEGQVGVVFRDKTWEKAQTIMDTALQTNAVPTWEQVEAQLPTLTWPD